MWGLVSAATCLEERESGSYPLSERAGRAQTADEEREKRMEKRERDLTNRSPLQAPFSQCVGGGVGGVGGMLTPPPSPMPPCQKGASPPHDETRQAA